MTPTVDILVAAYNAEKYLAASIESVISQSFQDWRILLVNDGSTDSTPEIADAYQQQLGPRMRVITQQNRGMSAARNYAIASSSAEFLAILDADDVWLPNRLQESVACLKAHPDAGLSYGLITRIDEHGKELDTFLGNQAHTEGWIAPAIFMRTVELPCVTVTIRRSCIEKVGAFDETMRATEDRDLWFRIALKYPVVFVPKVIAYYRVSNNSASANLDRMLAGQLTFIRRYRGSPGCGLAPYKTAVSRAYKQRAEALLLRGQISLALRDAYRACLIWPIGLDNLRTAASLSLISIRAALKS